MKISEYKEKLNASIKVPNVLFKINGKREKVEPLPKKRKSFVPVLRLAIGFGCLFIALLIIIPIAMKASVSTKHYDMADAPSNPSMNSEAASKNDDSKESAVGDNNLYSVYDSYKAISNTDSKFLGTLTFEDISSINSFIENSSSDTNDLVNEVMKKFNYSSDLINDVTYIVNLVCDN